MQAADSGLRPPVAGLDIGSRTIALVEWDGERTARAEVVDTGTDPVGNARSLIQGRIYRRLVATGYGRQLAAERELADEVISEIKAYGLGAHHLYSDAGTLAVRTARSSGWDRADAYCALR